MLDREFWVGTEKHPLGREEGERGMKGGGLERTRIREIPSTAPYTKITNNKSTTKNRHKQTTQ